MTLDPAIAFLSVKDLGLGVSPKNLTVKDLILDTLERGGWWTYFELQAAMSPYRWTSENSIAARLRELRQSGKVERRWRQKAKLLEWRAL